MHMVKIVLDQDLLLAVDQAARQRKLSRSALVREALRAHLGKLEIQALEEQERAGYLRIPEDLAEAKMWEAVAAWPEE